MATVAAFLAPSPLIWVITKRLYSNKSNSCITAKMKGYLWLTQLQLNYHA